MLAFSRDTNNTSGSYHHPPHSSQGLTSPHGAIVSAECCSLALFSPLQCSGKGYTVGGGGTHLDLLANIKYDWSSVAKRSLTGK